MHYRLKDQTNKSTVLIGGEKEKIGCAFIESLRLTIPKLIGEEIA